MRAFRDERLIADRIFGIVSTDMLEARLVYPPTRRGFVKLRHGTASALWNE